MSLEDQQRAEPPRTDAIPDSYAINVRAESIHVWERRVTAQSPTGEWRFVETLDPEDDPSVSVEYAEFTPAADGQYWVYCRTYECHLDCQ
ncbi:MAG: hypothetical protein ABEI27_03800 [Halobellus sp.]|uniref:hypothetical protein n=1 Tax=Halobellus sp. TaxID=1979212 RepID=UPI0035D4031B